MNNAGHSSRWKLAMTLALAFVPVRMVCAQIVDENGAWNGGTMASVGAAGSSFYAQSFYANVPTITKFGVVINEFQAEGELILAIAADDGSGFPNVSAPLYQGALRNPAPAGAWFYEDGLAIPVTVGQKYWVVIDGNDNAGATGKSAIGLSSSSTDTNEGMVYSNSGGGAWAQLPGTTLAIFVEGATTTPIRTAWNGSYISTVGAAKSDFYAQSFLATFSTITRFGVVLGESSPEGEVLLAIAGDNGSGRPDLTAPLYQGALRNPSPTLTWFFEEGVDLPVTPGQKYWVLIDGYNNAGATGNSRAGSSSTFTNTGERMIYTNDAGATWGMVGNAIATFVTGTAPMAGFTVSAPAAAVIGSSFTFTVTAKDLLGNTNTVYSGTLHFTCSDGTATLPLPTDATLTNGTGTFTATLNAIGDHTITVAEVGAPSISGTSGPITTAVPVELQRFALE